MGKLPWMDGYQMSKKKSKRITVTSPHCPIHNSFIVALEIKGSDWECDAIEGAFEGYIWATECTVCAGESIGLEVMDYIGVFIDRFLPLVTTAIPEPRVTFEIPARLSYG